MPSTKNNETALELSASQFGISPTFGFLPENQPLKRLPIYFDEWEDVATNLPKYLAGKGIRSKIESLGPLDLHDFKLKQDQLERLMVILSYLGHAYVWTGEKPATRLPAVLAKPWYEAASRLGRPPVLSYSSYCLHNWQLLDSSKPIQVGNVALNQNFYGGIDEEWFVLIHVDIEKRASPALNHLFPAQKAAGDQNEVQLTNHLQTIGESVEAMNVTMNRMLEWCDPYIYYHRVRPYIHGWKNHPDLPGGLVYEGVEAYQGKPQTFRGETGAQSSIVPALDAVLGVHHEADVLREYLMEMRLYMPPSFQRFIGALEKGPSVREYVLKVKNPTLTDAYNFAVHQLEKFRSKHLEYAALFIFKQAQTDPKNPHAVGTGGTPFMPYLKKHRDETETQVIH